MSVTTVHVVHSGDSWGVSYVHGVYQSKRTAENVRRKLRDSGYENWYVTACRVRSPRPDVQEDRR